uniref:Uncharacterized protein n=1 Tax=viral metagenome TaxID=1070528 RepID=A0A6C0K673_9ZZZZ
MQSKEEIEALVNWLNKNVPFVEIATFTQKIVDRRDVSLFEYRLNKWEYANRQIGYKRRSPYKLRRYFCTFEDRISKLDAIISRLREIYSTEDVDRILQYEKKKMIKKIRDPEENTDWFVNSFRRKYLSPKKLRILTLFINGHAIIDYTKPKRIIILYEK